MKMPGLSVDVFPGVTRRAAAAGSTQPFAGFLCACGSPFDVTGLSDLAGRIGRVHRPQAPPIIVHRLKEGG